jgi:hypothetical protein
MMQASLDNENLSFTVARRIFIATIAHIKVLMKSVDHKITISYHLPTRLNFFLQSLIPATAKTREKAKLRHARNLRLAVAAPALVSFQMIRRTTVPLPLSRRPSARVMLLRPFIMPSGHFAAEENAIAETCCCSPSPTILTVPLPVAHSHASGEHRRVSTMSCRELHVKHEGAGAGGRSPLARAWCLRAGSAGARPCIGRQPAVAVWPRAPPLIQARRLCSSVNQLCQQLHGIRFRLLQLQNPPPPPRRRALHLSKRTPPDAIASHPPLANSIRSCALCSCSCPDSRRLPPGDLHNPSNPLDWHCLSLAVVD